MLVTNVAIEWLSESIRESDDGKGGTKIFKKII